MAEATDIRWRQRLVNLQKAYGQLAAAISLPDYSDLEREGLIQRFEYTFELAWKTLQDLLEYRGYVDLRGARPVLEQAIQDGYLANPTEWMLMLKQRNLSTHTYNEEIAKQLAKDICEKYGNLFALLLKRLEEI